MCFRFVIAFSQGYSFISPSVLFSDNIFTDKALGGITEHEVLKVRRDSVGIANCYIPYIAEFTLLATLYVDRQSVGPWKLFNSEVGDTVCTMCL